MQAPQLKPLGIGEVLDVGIKIFTKHIWTFVKIVLLIVVPVQIITALIEISALGERNRTFFDTNSSTTANDTWTVLAGSLAILLISLLSTTIVTGACFKAVADGYLGRSPDWRNSLRFAARRVHSIFWVTVLGWILIVLASLLLIIPGIYLWAAYTVAVPVLLTEGTKGRKALKRSRKLVSGRWWSVFAVLLLATILTTIGGGIISGVFAAISTIHTSHTELRDFVVSVLGGTLSGVITTPLKAAFICVLYFDLRVRKEGFDLQLLAERIGVEPDLAQTQAKTVLGLPAGQVGPGQAGAREEISVQCPKCGLIYGDWHRPGAERDSSMVGDARMYATTATCPHCGQRVSVSSLEKMQDGVWRARSGASGGL